MPTGRVQKHRALARAPATAPIPPYGPSGVDADEWRAYLATTGGRIPALTRAPQRAPAPRFPVARRPNPEMRVADAIKQALADPETRFCNVQQPWEYLLSVGIKDVENRSRAFRGKWMFLVASKPSFGEAEFKRRLADTERRLAWNCAGLAGPVPPVPQHKAFYEKRAQHVTALLRVVTFDNSFTQVGKSSIWNSNDLFAWVIEAVWPLKEPVYYGPGTLGQVRASTVLGRDGLKERLLAAAEA
jgi:hypothetical protein